MEVRWSHSPSCGGSRLVGPSRPHTTAWNDSRVVNCRGPTTAGCPAVSGQGVRQLCTAQCQGNTIP
eukprot:13620564-Alexandrium_andersonii.AAC.1